ncbi:MAG TPA: hypothetical protein VNR36_10440 [Pseudolysinimonas sp.]|nr:hypothetical protein [Pseudolysinimonas sp.]
MPRVPAALLAVPLLALLAGCVGDPEPAPTPLTAAQACAALEDAVTEFYDIASPGGTVTAIDTYAVPEVKGFRMPNPTCAFRFAPDPAVTPGDVFTIEGFYLDYAEEMTVTLPTRLEQAGFRRAIPTIPTWSATRLGRSYSASVLVYQPGDGQAYSTAAEHFRVLNLTIGQT